MQSKYVEKFSILGHFSILYEFTYIADVYKNIDWNL